MTRMCHAFPVKDFDPRVQREDGLGFSLTFLAKLAPGDNEGLLSEPWRQLLIFFSATGQIACKGGSNPRPAD